MVELVFNLITTIVIASAIIAVAVVALLALKLYLSHKERKHTINDKPKSVEKSFDKIEEKDDEEKQVDYVESVYKLVDDVLSGKQELGEVNNETQDNI